MRSAASSFQSNAPVPKRPARRGLSLRWRLALLGVAGVLPLLLFVLGYQYQEFRQDVDANAERTLAMTRTLVQLVEAEIDIRIAALESLATAGTLQAGDFDTFRVRATTMLANQFPAAHIVLLRPDGQLLMGTRFPPGTPLPKRPDLDSTRQVFKTGKPAVSNLFQGTFGPVVAIDVPVKDSSGRVIYVLSMNPSLDVLANLIHRQQLPPNWVASVVDRHGVILAREPNGETYAGRSSSPAFLERLLNAPEGALENTSLEGIRVFSAFSHGARYGWAVGIGVPRAELIQPAVSSAVRILVVGGLILAASIAMALYLSRRIAQPMRLLRRLAAASDAASLPPLESTGVPEIDDVAAVLVETRAERNRSRAFESMLRDGIDSIPEGFSIYDSNDRLVMCNDSYRRLFSAPEIAVVEGARYEDMTREGCARAAIPPLAATKMSGSPIRSGCTSPPAAASSSISRTVFGFWSPTSGSRTAGSPVCGSTSPV